MVIIHLFSKVAMAFTFRFDNLFETFSGTNTFDLAETLCGRCPMVYLFFILITELHISGNSNTDNEHLGHIKNVALSHVHPINQNRMPRCSITFQLAEMHTTALWHMAFHSYPTSEKLINAFLCSSRLSCAIPLALTSSITPG